MGRQHQRVDRNGGLLRTGKRGESWLESHQWCPNDPYGLWESEVSEEDLVSYVSNSQFYKPNLVNLAASVHVN